MQYTNMSPSTEMLGQKSKLRCLMCFFQGSIDERMNALFRMYVYLFTNL